MRQRSLQSAPKIRERSLSHCSPIRATDTSQPRCLQNNGMLKKSGSQKEIRQGMDFSDVINLFVMNKTNPRSTYVRRRVRFVRSEAFFPIPHLVLSLITKTETELQILSAQCRLLFAFCKTIRHRAGACLLPKCPWFFCMFAIYGRGRCLSSSRVYIA